MLELIWLREGQKALVSVANQSEDPCIEAEKGPQLRPSNG